ncbi:putative Zinc finger C-x8-C-x5-C-x3-H type (and similar)/CCCH-type zinc finger containing protein [Leishmania shawi]|uniref:Zinc finger C-x8-C-x5-C-x3-H type (And similar)/CCCH-type zinc finger containing protein n=1 Tax=Leishmania shawi TaxID=5680 RepID=A0AAW3BMW8_9TRYP
MHPVQGLFSQAAMGPDTHTKSSPTLRLPTNLTAGPRLFTHAPYLTSGNIIASEDLDAVECGTYARADGHRRNQGPPDTGGPHQCGSTFSARHKSASQLYNPHGYPNGKKNVCRHFMNGSCNRGSSCRFYHPGPIHHVVTPTRPRTPIQRPLTPLADLALHNTAFMAQSPAHSPRTGLTSTLLRSSPRPLMMKSGGGSARSNAESFASPLSSPSNSASVQRSSAFFESLAQAVTTRLALSSPSVGPQFSPGTSLGARAFCGLGANPSPSLQLPDYLPNGSDDSTMENCHSVTAEDMVLLSRPHSPSSLGPHPMSVYRAGVRLEASSNSGSGEGIEAPASPHQNYLSGSSFPAVAPETDTSPRPGSVTRNNPYAYSPTGVQRQPIQPMSPLKRTLNSPQ